MRSFWGHDFDIITLSNKIQSHNTVPAAPYQMRLFNDLNLKFIKPFEVTAKCDGSPYNNSNKTDLKPFGILLESQSL